MDADQGAAPQGAKSVWVVVGLVLLLLAVLFILGWWLSQRGSVVSLRREDLTNLNNQVSEETVLPGETIVVASIAGKYGLRVANTQTISEFLASIGFWEQADWQVSNGPRLTGTVKQLKIVLTDELQPHSVEETLQGVIGSINAELTNGVMVLTVQTVPERLRGIGPDWHVESKVLLFLNKLADAERKMDEVALVKRYQDMPRSFEVYEL